MKNWENGRKLEDEIKNIQDWYFEPRYQYDGNLTDEERAEIKNAKARITINQAK